MLLLPHTKYTYVERLTVLSDVWQEVEDNDTKLFSTLNELESTIGLTSIKEKKPILTNLMWTSLRVEVLKPS